MDVYQPVGIGSDFLGYRIEELIGRGGMGVVYRAYDLRLKRPVALKLVAPSLARDEQFRERFARESELVMSLEHPNVVPIYDAGDVDGRVYLAMRLVDGTDLGSLLRTEGALEPARALAICSQVAAALDAAHASGLVHRDVKPSNVLLDSTGHVYLADFGLTRSLDDEVGVAEDRFVGTPAYLAPEQLEGCPVDGRADVYSLGCVLYECLTGERVFPRDSRLGEAWAHLEEQPPRASRRRHGLPEAFDRVVSRALAKSPDERYPTSGDLVEAAEQALGLRRSAGVRVAAIAVAAIATLLAASLAVALLVRGGQGPAAPPRTHGNTLVRIDPRTNAVQRVFDVGADPMAVAAWQRTVWAYSTAAPVVSEVDERGNRVHATRISVRPVEPRRIEGPVLAADSNGAWIVGHDQRGRGVLTLVFPGGGHRGYPIAGRPVAVATGLHAVWVLDHGNPDDRLLRLDPATGRLRVSARMPVSSRVDTLTFGFGHLWAVGSATGLLYRIDPRSHERRRIDLGQRAGQPAALLGHIWVDVSTPGGSHTTVLNPRTLNPDEEFGGGLDSGIGSAAASAFGSVWTYDVGHGEVVRWHPPNPVGVVPVTHAPTYNGSCMTSITATSDAVWVTLVPSINYACNFF